MIIQCSKCSAKFRFDDALMREEGVWVRCGLCRHEFFQSHPLASQAGNFEEPDIRDDKAARSVSDSTSTEKLVTVILDKKKDDEPKEAAPDKIRSTSVWRILAALLMALVVTAGVGYHSFPDIGRQVISDLSAYLPWLEKQQPQPSLEEGIKLETINQRFVANVSAGNLRVVEGVAVNQSGHPVTRLQVKATLMDAQNNILGTKRAYAGHVLSDAELMILTEEEMSRRLGTPGGSTASNDRIPPGGRIPFMIVWAFEPLGAAKTFVSVAGVERLLQ